MTILIIVRNLNLNKLFTNKYVIVSMYSSNKNVNKLVVKVKITWKVYLIDNLKVNIFIENNVLKFEKLDIFTSTLLVYTKNCEIFISIFIENRFVLQTISVYLIKASIILFRFEISIFIHKISLFERNYFFELAKANFAIYFYIINTITAVILIQNNDIKFIKSFRNFRLKNLIELKHFNALYVYSNFSNLAIRRLKLKQKCLYFQKIFNSITMTAENKNHDEHFNFSLSTSISFNTVFFNNVTVYNSTTAIVMKFSKLIDEYFSLWTNQEFANLSKNNWMKLLFKIDEKSKIRKN